MELSIEKWLKEQSFDTESIKLFHESIICYKAGAYRSGFLFSYLGFQSVTKNRILRAERPSSVKESFWRDISNKLLDDNNWEPSVFVALTSNKHGNIFNLNDYYLNTQLEYWRGIRNDCAHAKDNEIIAAHVESYWAFLRSNMPKFVVSGGVSSIINRIEKHFDIRYTPSESDPIHIINDMSVGLEGDDLIEVFKTLDKITIRHDILKDPNKNNHLTSALFWYNIIQLDNNTAKKCIDFLKTDDSKSLYHVLDAYPHLVTFLSDDAEFIRNLWYQQISKLKYPYNLLGSLLDNECIPQEETTEAIYQVINRSRGQAFNSDTLRRLDNYGFSKTFKEEVFLKSSSLINQFHWANNNDYSVSSFLKLQNLDTDIVTSICNAFKDDAHAFDLKLSLVELFNDNVEIKKQFIKIAEENNLDLPVHLDFD